MTQLATITQGDSQYDDRLWALLQETGIDPHEFEGLDYFGLIPFFVLAGATVTPQAHTHGTDVHVEAAVIDVPEEFLEGFFAILPEMLNDAYAEE